MVINVTAKVCPKGTKRIRGRCVAKKQKKPYVHKKYVGTTKAVTPVGEHDYRSFDMFVLEPTSAPAQKLTQEDVWGKYEESHWKGGIPNTTWIPGRRKSKGMIVASSVKGYSDVCPVWHDKIPYKSVTIICDKQQEGDCEYWLEYVHGGGSVTRRKELSKGKVALRSDYQAW